MDNIEHNNNEPQRDDVGVRSKWVIIAEEANRTIAEFAVNGLRSYDIPAVLDARPGFLGTAGLTLRSLRTGKVDTFKIMVPPEFKEEAEEVVKIFLGGQGDPEQENIDDENSEEGN
jgi:hypothetical protein